MPEKDKKLDEIFQLTRQNNKMLRGMRRAAFWGTVFKIILWAVLLGIPVYLYFTFFQPVVAQALQTYAQIQETSAQMQQRGSEIQGLFDQIPLEEIENLLENVPGVDFSGSAE